MKFISVNLSPEFNEIIEYIFHINNPSEILYLAIPGEFDQNDFIQFSDFLKQKIYFEIEKSKQFSHLENPNFDQNIKFDVFDTKENPENYLDLSIFYQYFDWVVVRSEIFEQSLKLNIGGFKGLIVDFYNDGNEDIFKIVFGSNSLASIPTKKLKSCFDKKISPFYTFLASDQVLPSIQTGSEISLNRSQVEILLNYSSEKIKSHWFNSQKQIPYDNKSPIFDYWESLLKYIFASQTKITAFNNQYESVDILSTAGSDEKYGVWLNVINKEKELIIPLSDITRISTPLKLNHDLKIYNYWASQFLT